MDDPGVPSVKLKPLVEVYTREDGKYDWRLKATNGQIIATSGGQGYERKAEAAADWLRVSDAAEWVREVRYV